MEDPVTQLIIAALLVIVVLGAAALGFILAVRQDDQPDQESGSDSESGSRYDSLSNFHPPPPRSHRSGWSRRKKG
jgi:hypothetical protein